MRHLAWYPSLALAVLLTPVAGGAQAQTDQAPRATVRELATVEGYVDGFVRLPEGRTVIYSVNDSTFAHECRLCRSWRRSANRVLGVRRASRRATEWT